ncbi:hypothetical protein QE152_g30126 [Popillia japonica]|uniref:Uncharacterized protein n=1 Tax=Popillia japonica TaxID=7064 RepID=A0AAW1JFL7_POPJA
MSDRFSLKAEVAGERSIKPETFSIHRTASKVLLILVLIGRLATMLQIEVLNAFLCSKIVRCTPLTVPQCIMT